MRIGLTYDLKIDPSDERQAEYDSPETLKALEDALRVVGHDGVRLGNAQNLLKAPEKLKEVEFVFNIAEGKATRCREAWVPLLLELYDVSCVGSDALTLSMGLDKVLCKQLAQASGVSTPAWISVRRPDALPSKIPFAFPVIVKPRYGGSGMGLDRGAVVHDMPTLSKRVREVWDRFHQDMLVESFVAYGELTVFLIGNHPPRVLPVIQRPLDPESRLAFHIVDGAARWKRQPTAKRSDDPQGLCPLDLTESMEEAASQMALTMFHALGCYDMARVDLRVDSQGQLFFLEINPLPSFDPNGSLGLLAEYLGRSYASLIDEIIQAALMRINCAKHH